MRSPSAQSRSAVTTACRAGNADPRGGSCTNGGSIRATPAGDGRSSQRAPCCTVVASAHRSSMSSFDDAASVSTVPDACSTSRGAESRTDVDGATWADVDGAASATGARLSRGTAAAVGARVARGHGNAGTGSWVAAGGGSRADVDGRSWADVTESGVGAEDEGVAEPTGPGPHSHCAAHVKFEAQGRHDLCAPQSHFCCMPGRHSLSSGAHSHRPYRAPSAAHSCTLTMPDAHTHGRRFCGTHGSASVLYSYGLHSYGYGLCSYGAHGSASVLYSYGRRSHGIHRYGLHSYGLHSYGLLSYGVCSYELWCARLGVGAVALAEVGAVREARLRAHSPIRARALSLSGGRAHGHGRHAAAVEEAVACKRKKGEVQNWTIAIELDLAP